MCWEVFCATVNFGVHLFIGLYEATFTSRKFTKIKIVMSLSYLGKSKTARLEKNELRF